MNRLAAVGIAAMFAVAPAAAHAQAQPDPLVRSMRSNWMQVTNYITAAAEEMTEADYAFRPVATVRTFGALIGHVAGSQFMICAAALGEPQRAEDAIEKSAKTKAALVAALKESTKYCERAYALSSTQLAGQTQLFGQNVPKANAIMLNAVHNGEHYGNIITYMRMKGLVPPSSK